MTPTLGYRLLTCMEAFLDGAAQGLGMVYAIYVAALGLTSLVGVHLLVLASLLAVALRRFRPNGFFSAGERAHPLQFLYGFFNPLVYLLILKRPGALVTTWSSLDAGMATIGWTMFAALWGARLLLPADLETSPAARARLHRLCVLALICLAAFALRDAIQVWWPTGGSHGEYRGRLGHVWMLVSFAPLYAIPALILNGYRARLSQATDPIPFLLLPRGVTRRLALTFATIAVVVVGASLLRPSDTIARRRVQQLTPAIEAAAVRYGVDPRLLAAIVYVSEREVGPFRDQVERFASGLFLFDESSHLFLSRPFDLSIGAAQIKPVTALTALKLCKTSGEPWDLWYKHLRDVPILDQAWAPSPSLRAACQAPTSPVPSNKPQVMTALRQDESNVAFAALILALYQRQWRDANPAWDISGRPEILATLYQIGFVKSRPHGAPRSSAFGQRVAEVAREPWLRDRFDRGRAAMSRSAPQ